MFPGPRPPSESLRTPLASPVEVPTWTRPSITPSSRIAATASATTTNSDAGTTIMKIQGTDCIPKHRLLTNQSNTSYGSVRN